jgi:signal transduction histidine kinase
VLDERLPRVSGDRELIRMVLANLLDNARAHAGPQAKTRLVIRGGLEQVWVSVEDNGAGIPAEILDTALDPFIRGDEAQGGSGLGLAIVRAILRSHGTEPQLESAPGRGTRISFRLRGAD